MAISPSKFDYPKLKAQLVTALQQGRAKVSVVINQVMVRTYWEVGRHIVEYEQKGEDRAIYGDRLLDRLSKDLSLEFGKGFSRSNLFQIRAFYLKFQKIQTLSGQLSWSHYLELSKADSDLEISFYSRQSEKENWSVRELKRQMKSMLFHRLALSKDKNSILDLAEHGAEIQTAKDLLRDPYVFEFLGIPSDKLFTEGELEQSLIDNLQHFLLELGKGFAFIGRQYKITIGGRHFFVDLVFYHRILKCFVLFDLKRGEIDHQDIGQMNLYLNYFRKEENVTGDNEPVGIILGAYQDQILVEYATENITNQLLVSKYQVYLPDKKELAKELERLLFKQ